MSSKRIFQALAELEDSLGREVRGAIVDTAGADNPVEAPLSQLNLVARGWALKCQIEDLDAQLRAINQQLLNDVGVGHAIVADGIARVTLAERHTVDITEPVQLRALLGNRFNDLVKVNVIYKPEPKLIELACGADDEQAMDIRTCLTVKSSSAVTWRPDR